MRTEATRTKLVRAAYGVFIKDGFAGASIDDVAEKAGYSRGAFYANFDDKEDLLFAVYEQLLSATLNSLRCKIKPASTVSERIAAIRDYYVELVEDRNRLLFLLEFRLYVIRNAKALRRLEKLRATGLAELDDFLRLVFSDWSCELQMRPETMHRAFIGLLYGLSVESLFRPQYLSKDEARTIALSFFEHVWRPSKEMNDGQQLRGSHEMFPMRMDRQIEHSAAISDLSRDSFSLGKQEG